MCRRAALLLLAAALAACAARPVAGAAETSGNTPIPGLNSEGEVALAQKILRATLSVAKTINTGEEDDFVEAMAETDAAEVCGGAACRHVI